MTCMSTDTYFVVAHFHYIMVGGMVTAYFGGLHYWWPKITGRLYSEDWARAAAILIFFGFNLTFFPQFILGVQGMPRRYHVYPPEFQTWNVMSSGGAAILAVAYLLPLFYLGYSLFFGARASANPWDAPGLEWQTPSPPPRIQFQVQPVVTRAPYQYTPRQRRGTCAKCLNRQPFAFSIRRPAPAARRGAAWHVGLSSPPKSMFFGGLILAYSAYRIGYTAGFAAAARHTEIVIGASNTAILLTGSFSGGLGGARRACTRGAHRGNSVVGGGGARRDLPRAQRRRDYYQGISGVSGTRTEFCGQRAAR